MKTITYKLKDLEEKKEKKVTLKLGYVGENEHVQIRIDCAEIWKDYPAAVASLAVEPPEGDKYPAIVTRDGDMVCWTVKDSDLVNDGYGRIQLTFTEGSEIQKTVICRTKVDESIVGSGTAPDPIADFVAEANEVLAELEAAEVHGPVIGEDGYWYTWSKDAGEYVKTDTKAQGEDGQQGPAGKDGADGVPGQDGHTPVKGTDYWTQQDQADIVAAAALETVSAVIDDAAGDGDTNKTWSADKIAETTGQLLNSIQGVETLLNEKVNEPAQEGSAGSVLTTDGDGQRTWSELGKIQKASVTVTNETLVIGSASDVGTWTLVKNITTTEDGYITITTDDNGDDLALTSARILVIIPENVTYNTSCNFEVFNNTRKIGGAWAAAKTGSNKTRIAFDVMLDHGYWDTKIRGTMSLDNYVNQQVGLNDDYFFMKYTSENTPSITKIASDKSMPAGITVKVWTIK